MEANRGCYCGTWAQLMLAVIFARWQDVHFSGWCDVVIEDILNGASEVTIVRSEESAVLAVPQGYAAVVLTSFGEVSLSLEGGRSLKP